MKTFDIPTTLAYPTFDDGEYIQDERAWAQKLFGQYFEERELVYGRDYHLERCPGQNIRVCFRDAGEALWFKSNSEVVR